MVLNGFKFSFLKVPLVIRSVHAQKNVTGRFVSTLIHPSPPRPTTPFKNVMKIFMKIFYLSFSFRDIRIDSFAFLSLDSIIVQLEIALNSLYQKQPSRGVLRERCFENMQQIYGRTPL